MTANGLKLLFIQSEIIRIKSRIAEYENIYNGMYKDSNIKDLSLRRLISNKQRELNILENMFKSQYEENSNNE